MTLQLREEMLTLFLTTNFAVDNVSFSIRYITTFLHVLLPAAVFPTTRHFSDTPFEQVVRYTQMVCVCNTTKTKKGLNCTVCLQADKKFEINSLTCANRKQN